MVPFNVASYSLLLHMVAHLTNRTPREFIHTIGDAHIYSNHIEQVNLQLGRALKSPPSLELISPPSNIDDFNSSHFKITDYDPHPTIKAPISV